MSSLKTLSTFYFGHVVTNNNFSIDFDEGSGPIIAQLRTGTYSLTDFAIEVARAMTKAGLQTYTVTTDRATRQLTISASSSFDLLVSSGASTLISAFPLMGFTGADRVLLSSYEGDSSSGSEYRPQFLLQKYIPFSRQQKKAFGSVNKSASGKVQVISFGQEEFAEFEIVYATNLQVGNKGPIEENLSGVEALESFFQTITDKGEFEFIPDRDNPSVFTRVILESTESDSNGIGYKIIQQSGDLAEHFRSGLIKLRKV